MRTPYRKSLCLLGLLWYQMFLYGAPPPGNSIRLTSEVYLYELSLFKVSNDELLHWVTEKKREEKKKLQQRRRQWKRLGLKMVAKRKKEMRRKWEKYPSGINYEVNYKLLSFFIIIPHSLSFFLSNNFPFPLSFFQIIQHSLSFFFLSFK